MDEKHRLTQRFVIISDHNVEYHILYCFLGDKIRVNFPLVLLCVLMGEETLLTHQMLSIHQGHTD